MEHSPRLGEGVSPRILIVDDSALLRKSLRRWFECEPGWQVTGEAANGREAIDKACELHPNIILLDLSMPEMNGLEAAKALMKIMPAVPLVMFTSFMTANLESEALACGITKVLIKSDPIFELIGCVRSLVHEAA